jgi:alanyl-tRNA synthetase
VISGADAFKLYDTYGFPLDLTKLMAEERGMRVDDAGYEAELERAKEVSRAGPAKEGGEKQLVLTGEQVARLKHLGVQPTDDTAKYEVAKPLKAHVRAIWNGHNFDEHTDLHVGDARKKIGIITDRTNFYATMGGQEGDSGEIQVLGNATHTGEFEVDSTHVFGGYVLHIGHVQRGALRVGDTVTMNVTRGKRGKIQSNHTATHLANWALREVLGDTVDQKGSLVADDRFRFDFSNNAPVSGEQLAKVEELVAKQIAANYIVHAELAPLSKAKDFNSLRAVFGETYPDPVRVVSIGVPLDDLLANASNPEWRQYSIEFCGGTHVAATGEIGSFAVLSEEAVAKGVRRIVAVTGEKAAEAARLADGIAANVARAGALPADELPKAVAALLTEVDAASISASRKTALRAQIAALQEKVKAMGKQVAAAMEQKAIAQARAIAQSAQNSNSLVVVSQIDCGDDRQALQSAVKVIRDTLPRVAVMLFAVDEAGKAMMHASVPDAGITKGLKAGAWLREAASAMGGKGGGKDDNAQGGAPNGQNVRDAMRAAEQVALKALM